MGVLDSAAAVLRTITNETLPDTATVARTGLTIICRVNDTGRAEGLQNLPAFAQERLWRLTFPNGSDVSFGDSVAVTFSSGGSSTYTVIMAGSSSYPTAVTVWGVLPGSTLYDTQTVTFTDTGVSPRLTTPVQNVLVYEAAKDAAVAPEAARYQWAVAFPATLRYSNGDQVSAGDLINWSGLPGGSASISKPRPTNDPRNQLLVAYFGET